MEATRRRGLKHFGHFITLIVAHLNEFVFFFFLPLTPFLANVYTDSWGNITGLLARLSLLAFMFRSETKSLFRSRVLTHAGEASICCFR